MVRFSPASATSVVVPVSGERVFGVPGSSSGSGSGCGEALGVAATDATGPGPSLFTAQSSKVYSVSLVRLLTVSVKSVLTETSSVSGPVPSR